MSPGPTEELLRRARHWAEDAEELAGLQWQLFQLEFAELAAKLRRSVLLFLMAVGLAALGLPLAVVAGLVVLAQAMDWPVAQTLAIAGGAFVVLAGGLAFAAQRSWVREHWLSRSRREFGQNLRGIFASWRASSRGEYPHYSDHYTD